METYWYGSFLKYTQIWKEFKRSHRITGETMFQLTSYATSARDELYLVGSLAKGVSEDSLSPQTSQAIARITPRNLFVRPYCWRYHSQTSSNTETPSWCPTRSFTRLLTSTHGVGRYFACCRREKVIINFTWLQTLWCGDLPARRCNCGTNVMGTTNIFF